MQQMEIDMDTRHIKAAKLMSVDDIFEAHAFEFPHDDQWGIQFEVSEAFKKAFFAHLDAAQGVHIYEGMSFADGAECGLSEDETRVYWLYHYEGQNWSLTNHGDLMMQVTYDDLFEKEIPETAWTLPVALIKTVLRSIPKES
jgi:hypothetical protein